MDRLYLNIYTLYWVEKRKKLYVWAVVVQVVKVLWLSKLSKYIDSDHTGLVAINSFPCLHYFALRVHKLFSLTY